MKAAVICAVLVCGTPWGLAGGVEVTRHVVLIQGFEGQEIFARKEHVSYLSGVPEEAEVEVRDTELYQRRKFPHRHSGIVCRISGRHVREGRAALEAKFTRPDRVLRVSLRNNINQPARNGRPACNSLGCFDYLKGDIYNPASRPVAVELTMLGGFAVTDKARTFSLVRTIVCKPGWNTFAISSQEASATFVDPHDATCVEFRTPSAPDAVLYFDNFRMERGGIGVNMARFARCFDFGVSWFTWPGFAYGSVPWDPKRGFGFTAGSRLTHGGDLHVINDQLTRDGFLAPASFRVALPNGEYHVVARTGNYWGRRDGGRNIEIRAEGKRAYYRPRFTRRQFLAFKYAHERTDHFKRNLDLWKTYEDGTYSREVEFDVEVADGALDLEFLLPPSPDGKDHGDSVWNYLIVYPADKERLIRPEIDWLNEKIRSIYNTVSHVPISRQFALYNREEVICPEEFLYPQLAQARRDALRPTPAQRRRGYLHFLRHRHDLITPDGVPLPSECDTDTLELFAARGETAAWTVGIYPLADLRQVDVAVGDFRDSTGKVVIPAGAVEVRLVSYRPMTPVTSNHAECFHYIGPGVLIPPKPTDVPKGYPRRWWFSLRLPADATEISKGDVSRLGYPPAGVLRGSVAVTVAGKRRSAVQVLLRVLPFALEQPAGVTFAVAHDRPRSFWGEGRTYELEFFRRIGLTHIWYQGPAEELPTMRRLARRCGLKVERGHPDKYLNWRWPENYRHVVIRRLLAQGKKISFTPRHTGHREGRRIRFTHGFWLWRSGIRHRVIQSQPNACERVYYAHCGHAKFGPCSYRFPSIKREGLILPSPTFYEVRDGIIDWRYIQTLESAVREARAGRPSPALRAAEDCLRELTQAVNPSFDYYAFRRKRNFNHVGRYGYHDTYWKGRRYQMARWALARHIAALKGRPIETAAGPRPASRRRRGSIYAEYFGPLWVDAGQYRLYKSSREGQPRLQTETPQSPVGKNWITVLVKLDHRCKTPWTAVIRDAAGRELARQAVGVLKRWKTRWVLFTDHLPVGRYTLELLPADGTVKLDRPIRAEFEIVPGII